MINVIDAIKQRHSVRAFIDKPVSLETVNAILEAARYAPSGVNTQPWHVYVVTGSTKTAISEAIMNARAAGVAPHPDYTYYPTTWCEPYKSRRFACGMALYGALEIGRDDKKRREEVWEMNYRFFGAPVGLFIAIDAHLEKGSWMDIGMFMQNIFLAAMGFGLATCPQAALAEFPNVVRDLLQIPVNQHIVSGIALGFEDKAHPINQYRTAREPLDNFVKIYV